MSETVCDKCGAFGDMLHTWLETDCILQHRTHSRANVGHICQRCCDRHRSWLTEIVELYAGLPDVVDPSSIPDDTAEHKHTKKKPASPAPVRLDAWVMLADTGRLFTAVTSPLGGMQAAYLGSNLPDIPAVLTGWAQNAIDATGVTDTAPQTVSGAATVLTTHAETIGYQPWVDEYDAEIRWVRASLRRAHGIRPQKRLGACITVTDGKDCGGSVWPDRDGGKPRCDKCARRYGTLDLVRLKAMQRAEAS